MKTTVKAARRKALKQRMLRKKIISGRFTEKDLDNWMSSVGAEPIPASEAAQLQKKGRLRMPDE